ncbi:LysR family transcriptional regulator [Paraburkholderia fungorum]|uniref:helix-turn-helix domain-containing protein n=1 Tax=Paraburkholderia fungorum TaxID=134537 RepID=UPI0033139D0B
MNQLAAMRMFTKVAESLNFSIAAKQLGVSSAVITRSISTLESHLNIRLSARVKLVVVSVMLPMALYRSSAYTF